MVSTLFGALLLGAFVIHIASANIASGKVAYQSSTEAGAVASRSTDGNTNSVFTAGSCSQTESDTKSWWMVDLGSAHDVSQVTVYNVVGGTSLMHVDIIVTSRWMDHAYPPQKADGLCAHDHGPVQPVETYTCNNMIGRYVAIRLNHPGTLTLCEVEVVGVALPCLQPDLCNNHACDGYLCDCFPGFSGLSCQNSNLAFGNEGFQSSTQGSYNAFKAVDGNTNPILTNGFCSLTQVDTNAWWAVDLTELFTVHAVNLYVWGGGDPVRHVDIIVMGRRPAQAFPPEKADGLCAHDHGPLEYIERYPCNGMVGRYVVVRLNHPGSLGLCEVQVDATSFPCPLQCNNGYCNGNMCDCDPGYTGEFCDKSNIAMEGPATQSTTVGDAEAERAVDGVSDLNARLEVAQCTRTEHATVSWWAVDLGSSKEVSEITIYNWGGETDPLMHVDIIVTDVTPGPSSPPEKSDGLCAHDHGPVRNVGRYRCPLGLAGRYVAVRLTHPGRLSLCEVQVAEREMATCELYGDGTVNDFNEQQVGALAPKKKHVLTATPYIPTDECRFNIQTKLDKQGNVQYVSVNLGDGPVNRHATSFTFNRRDQCQVHQRGPGFDEPEPITTTPITWTHGDTTVIIKETPSGYKLTSDSCFYHFDFICEPSGNQPTFVISVERGLYDTVEACGPSDY